MNKKSLDSLATAISYIFSPVALMPLFLILITVHSGFAQQEKFLVLGLFIFLGILPIELMLLFLKQTGRISDWDVTQRRERIPINVFSVAVGTLLLFILARFNQPQIFTYYLYTYVWFFLYAIITFFWKISAHTSAVTVFCLSLVTLFGSAWWWLFILIPAVAWARVYRKRHTLTQALSGIGLSAILYLFLVK